MSTRKKSLATRQLRTTMFGNNSCYIAGCKNSIIGQCVDCHRFYCREHGDRKCKECQTQTQQRAGCGFALLSAVGWVIVSNIIWLVVASFFDPSGQTGYATAIPIIAPVFCCAPFHSLSITGTEWLVVGMSFLWGYGPIVFIAVRQFMKSRGNRR